MDPFLGEIRLFAFSRAPTDWMSCDGQTLSISEYELLFALLGTTYGGDGVTNFALPGLNGRVPIGQGTGPGLSPRVVGQSDGSETVTLTMAQVPAHAHQQMATTVNNSTKTIGPTVMFGGDSTGAVKHYYTPPPAPPTPVPPPWRNLAPTSVSSVGGGAPHNNVMPGIGMNYCICWNGIWPAKP